MLSLQMHEGYFLYVFSWYVTVCMFQDAVVSVIGCCPFIKCGANPFCKNIKFCEIGLLAERFIQARIKKLCKELWL